MNVTFDEDEITFEDLLDFEDITGHDLLNMMSGAVVRCPGADECEYEHDHRVGKPVPDPDDPKGRPLRDVKTTTIDVAALAFIAMRHADPSLTFDAFKKTTIKQFELVTETSKSGDEPDPQ